MTKGMFGLTFINNMIWLYINNSNTRYIIGIYLKQISSFLLWTINYKDREKWIRDKPSWMPSQKLKPSY